MLNKVQLIGRLGQDPQLKYTQTGSPIANFTIATDESFTDREGMRQERTEWHRIVVFQKTAENCGRYLHKGSLVYVEGSLQTRKWQDQQGMDHFMTEVKAQRVVFLDKRQNPDELGQQKRFMPQGRMGDGGYGPDPGMNMMGQDPMGMDNRGYSPNYGSEGSPFPQDAQGEALNPMPSESMNQYNNPMNNQQNVNPAAPNAPAPNNDQGLDGNQEKSSMDGLPF